MNFSYLKWLSARCVLLTYLNPDRDLLDLLDLLDLFVLNASFEGVPGHQNGRLYRQLPMLNMMQFV